MTARMLLVLFLSTPLLAQHQAITAASAGERMRFTSPDTAAQIRVQILSIDGGVVFDSAWSDGNVFDWPAEGAVNTLVNGSYRCLVTVRDLDGKVTEKEATVTSRDARLSMEGPSDASGAKVTLLAHDGSNGTLVSTAGDLSFRFGDFLAGKDVERMRLTADGELRVEGVIRASKGIVLPDGTILGAVSQPRAGAAGSMELPHTPAPRPAATSSRLTPRPTFTPDFQFVVGDTGVKIGTTNPAYNLDVTGYINTTTRYDLGGMAFAHNHGTNNTFVGVSAGNFTGFGNSNTAVGTGALLMNTDGSFNTAVGRNALTANTTGNQNTAAGNGALATLVGGGSNTGLGFSALNATSAGSNNTAAGATALESNTGNNNTALGAQALRNKTSGDNNLAVGSFAGSNISTGSNNIDIGNAGDAADSSTIRIGTVNQNRTFITAIRGVTTDTQTAIPVLIDPLGQLGTASSSRRFKFDIADMDGATDGLMQLRPVTFRYIAQGPNAALQYGLIAEEVEGVYPELVAHDKDGQVEAVAYQFLAPMLLNEVQKQHRKIEALQAQVDRLARQLKEIQSRR